MKRNFLALTILATASIFNISAQSKQINKPFVLTTEADSLSYAYGVSTAKQGLNQYLEQLGVVSSAVSVESSYADKIREAATNVEKQKLEKELKQKVDSINTANKSNINSFLEGMNERLAVKNHNSSYYTGLEIASQFERMSNQFTKEILGNGASFNMHALLEGVANVLKNEPEKIQNSQQLIESRMANEETKSGEKKKQEYAEKIAAGEKFMAEISLKDGAVKLPSGILYIIDKEGHGAIPTSTDRVKVHYTGRLTNGTVFDSSVDRGEPITFGVSQVIPGWTEILQKMPVGSKWTVYIPYILAYGENGAGGQIEPFSNLIFEIELLEIEK